MKQVEPENRDIGFKGDFFQSIGCIAVELDAAGNVVRMNPVAENFFGFDADEISGKPFVGTLAPETAGNGLNQIAVFEEILSRPGAGVSFELEMHTRPGGSKVVTWSTASDFNTSGNIENIRCFGIDRQACYKNENDFDRKYDLLESFLETSKVYAYALDAEHRFVYVSPGIEKLFGYHPEEVMGRTPEMFFDENEKVRLSDLMAEEIRKGSRQIRVVNQTRHKNGSMVWSESTANMQFDQMGNFYGISGLVRDIDAQVKAEAALADREKTYRFCLEHAQVMLTVTDGDGVIRSINRVGADMFGRKPEEMIGRLFIEFLPDFEKERVLQVFQKDFKAAMASKASRTVGMGGFVNKIKAPDGLKDILFYKTGIKVYRNGKFEGILNTAVDITETVRTREELKRHRNWLEQLAAEQTAELQGLEEEMMRRERLTALGKMANVISEEVRTPLSTISNSFFVLSERLKDKDIGVKRSLERASRAIQRCYSIVDEFKGFTQSDFIKKEITYIDDWLSAMLDKVAAEKGITVHRELGAGVPVEIDRDRIERAVVNVLENAWQAGNNAPLVVRSKHAFSRLEIEIEDAGTGIPRQDLEKVFEPLFTTKTFGLGLGLPICRQVMDLHGGGISIESEEKKGTKVLLWIPLDDVP